MNLTKIISNPDFKFESQPDICSNFSTERFSWFYVLMFGIYVFTAVSISYMEGYNYLSKYIGYTATVLALIKIILRGVTVSREILFYGSWLIWSCTGVFVYISPVVFWTRFFTVMQLFILFLLVIRISDNYKNLLGLSVFYFLGVLLVVLLTFITGDFNYGIETGERITGTAGNANSLSVIIHHMLFIQFAYFELSKKKWIKVSMLALLPFQAKVIVATGSKKGLIFFLFVILVWFLFFHMRDVYKKPHIFLILMTLGTLFMVWFFNNIIGTTLYNRLLGLQATLEGGGGDDYARITLAKKGIQVFIEHPIFGVGLDNFRFYSGIGVYAHNTYIELLTNGGLIGFLLMFSVLLSLFLRGCKGMKSSITNVSVISKIVVVYFLYVFLISMVSPLYYDKFHWIMLGFITAFYVHRNKVVKNENSY
ncbi:MAG: O-antigen ligase family protein [Sedimentisphaeraceae bacterium JB056]